MFGALVVTTVTAAQTLIKAVSATIAVDFLFRSCDVARQSEQRVGHALLNHCISFATAMALRWHSMAPAMNVQLHTRTWPLIDPLPRLASNLNITEVTANDLSPRKPTGGRLRVRCIAQL